MSELDRARPWRRSSTPSPAGPRRRCGRSVPSTRSPPGAGAAAARPRSAGWPTGWSSARTAGCSTRARGWAGRPAGWPPRGGVRPVCAEPMAAAAGAGRRLFGLPSVVALGQALPFADGVVRRRLVPRRAVHDLRQGRRAGRAAPGADRRRPPGPAGLRRRRAPAAPPPEGNEFPGEAELRGLLADAGFRLVATAEADLADSPPEWDERAEAVEAEVARRHGDDPALRQAEEQSGRVGRLLSDGALRPWLGIAVAAEPRVQRNPCKELFALLAWPHAHRAGARARRPGHRRPRPARARPPAAQPAARPPPPATARRPPASSAARSARAAAPPATTSASSPRTASSRRPRGRAPRASAGGGPGTG